MAWQTPKTDWTTNPKNPKSEDFNRIEGNIDFLKTDIGTKKGLIVDAISDMNQPALVTDTHAELANKIRSISSDANAATGDVEKGKTFYSGGTKKTGTLELTGDAATGDVLSGKTFYNNDLKAQRTGAMPNKGAVTITPGQTEQTIPAGYHNGSGKVPAVVFDASKVLTGTTIAGKTGTMPNRGRAIITPGTTNKTIAQGYHDGTGYVVGDTDLKAANIRKGVDIFGVTGSLAEAPWFNDWSAYSTEYNWSGAGTSIAAESWGTLLTKSGEGVLCFLRTSGIGDHTAVMPPIRLTVDGVAYEFEEGSGYNLYARETGNIVFQPVYFKQGLKVEVYNKLTAALSYFLDYTCLMKNGTPDASSQTILTGSRKAAVLFKGGTLLSVSAAGWLLGILVSAQHEFQSQANGTSCTITIDGSTIMSNRRVVYIGPSNPNNLMLVFLGPIRFTAGCGITITDEFGTDSYARAWYVLD